MSDYATAPETYAAWRHLELHDELRPFDAERAEILRGNEELRLLLTDLEKSPTVEKLELYLKRDLEHRLFIQRSQARTLDRYHCQKICIVDLEARPEAYPCFGTEEEIRQRVELMRRKYVELAPLMAEMEEGQRSRAENEDFLAFVDSLITDRGACEEYDESDPSVGRA